MGINIELSEDELRLADRLAESRLTESSRRHSPDRPTARNPASQRRGAVGEIAAARFLRGQGFEVEAGFEGDEEGVSDLTADGSRLEVMTAQVAHRQKTGFCVPPNKLWAARKRGAVGYVFAGTGPETHPREVEIQGGVKLEHVDADPHRATYVNNPKFAVDNYVVRPEHLLTPEELCEMLRHRS